jgi:hypothetical protein
MERALRSPHNRLSTPDVVRSTITKKKELKYNEETIDTILGKPKKINIPERYVPEVVTTHLFHCIISYILVDLSVQNSRLSKETSNSLLGPCTEPRTSFQ